MIRNGHMSKKEWSCEVKASGMQAMFDFFNLAGSSDGQFITTYYVMHLFFIFFCIMFDFIHF
jgi:hypothetical protein